MSTSNYGVTELPRSSAIIAPFRWALQPFSPGNGRGTLSIFIYHRVHAKADPLFIDEADATHFDRQMEWVAGLFNVLPLEEATHRLAAGRLPPRAAAITFDDGYADNAQVALTILKRHALPATFFICTGTLNGGRMWNDTVIEAVRRAPGNELDLSTLGLGRYPVGSPKDRNHAIQQLLRQLKHLSPEVRAGKVDAVRAKVGERLPDDLMMTSEQVRALHRAGMGIGAHTVSHPILSRLDPAQVRQEITVGRQTLASIIDAKISLFAYPNGKPGEDYGPEHVAIVRELGFSAAFSTAWGAARKDSDYFQLPRFTPWDKSLALFSLRSIQNVLRGKPQVA